MSELSCVAPLQSWLVSLEQFLLRQSWLAGIVPAQFLLAVRLSQVLLVASLRRGWNPSPMQRQFVVEVVMKDPLNLLRSVNVVVFGGSLSSVHGLFLAFNLSIGVAVDVAIGCAALT